ncbi:MAG: response regulator transcription factor [Armatimonadetes bacterium]|nr:response regulator transcription factor [Armatimonadota bacterium]MDE2206682.1 response regulator transcription factor [Armatimonadota bacterium]
MPEPLRVLIADDFDLLRQMLAAHINAEPDMVVCGEAMDGSEAISLAESLAPDVVLMDLSMPLVNGTEACAAILRARPETAIILLTSHTHLLSVARAAGAVDALPKNCSPSDVTEAVRRAAAEIVALRLEANLAEPDRTMVRLGRRMGLSALELAVARKLVGSELGTDAIAEVLTAEMEAPVSTGAVRHATERVMTKLNVEPRTRYTLVKQIMDAAAAD